MSGQPEITPISEGWEPAPHHLMDGIARWKRDGDLIAIGLGEALRVGEATEHATGCVRLYRYSEPARHFDRLEDALQAANEPRSSFNIRPTFIPAALKRKS